MKKETRGDCHQTDTSPAAKPPPKASLPCSAKLGDWCCSSPWQKWGGRFRDPDRKSEWQSEVRHCKGSHAGVECGGESGIATCKSAESWEHESRAAAVSMASLLGHPDSSAAASYYSGCSKARSWHTSIQFGTKESCGEATQPRKTRALRHPQGTRKCATRVGKQHSYKAPSHHVPYVNRRFVHKYYFLKRKPKKWKFYGWKNGNMRNYFMWYLFICNPSKTIFSDLFLKNKNWKLIFGEANLIFLKNKYLFENEKIYYQRMVS